MHDLIKSCVNNQIEERWRFLTVNRLYKIYCHKNKVCKKRDLFNPLCKNATLSFVVVSNNEFNCTWDSSLGST